MLTPLAIWRNADRPYSMLDTMRRELDRVFSVGTEDVGEGGWYSPRADIAETDKQYEIQLDLPGVKAEDVDVQFHEGRLWITGKRETNLEEENKTFHRVERTYGQFRRAITLGSDVNPDEVQANYNNGVLKIIIPKMEIATPKKITVKTSQEGA